MENSTEAVCREPRWKAYLLAAALLLPGLVLWTLSAVFFAPKLQQIWNSANGVDPETQWVMDTVMFLVRHGGLIVGIMAVALVLGEVKPRWWSRYRRVAIGSLVVIINTAIVSGIWFMCLASLLVVPALIKAK